MADSRPLWRSAFDAAERAVGPRLERGVQTGTFADALALATRSQAGVRRLLERRTRQVWHLVNLPAGSDVRRLRADVLRLQRELTALRELLDEEQAPPQRAAKGARRGRH